MVIKEAQSLYRFSENEKSTISERFVMPLSENFWVIDSLIREKSKISAFAEVVEIIKCFGF